MKDIMKKTIFAVVLISTAVLACSRNIFNFNEANKSPVVFDKDGYWKTPDFRIKLEKDGTVAYYGSNSKYGAYLAGRVAHMRHDFTNATEYYKIVLEKDPKNIDISRYTYQLMALNGDFDEAAVFAKQDINSGDKGIIPLTIAAVNDFQNGQYEKARNDVLPLNKEPAYKNIVNPLFNAWTFAGEKNEKDAILSLNKIKEQAFISLQLIHKGLIYEYLGNIEKADECFSDLLKNYPQEVTYRVLDIVTNFYARTGNKSRAQQIFSRYNDNSSLSLLISGLKEKIEQADPKSNALIDTPQKGLAEVMFNIGTIYRVSNNNELAPLYIAAATYLNPKYEIAKLALANIYEENGLYTEANRNYAQIKDDSGSYFIARLKMIENLNTMKDYPAAEKALKELLKEYPNNTQLLNNLADIERKLNKTEEAIKLYKKALEVQKQPDNNIWPVYYALGTSYYTDKQLDKADEYLTKALKLSNRNPNVLNYIGYMYLTNDKDIDVAVKMILDAYNQYSYEGHIIDSLGWVFFRLGEYDKAIAYLEQAADMNPANAVICDHLGDAYWFGGRKNEAVFQWQHALVLKEDADSIDHEIIQKKIDDGVVENKIISLQKQEIYKELNALNPSEEAK